MRIVCLAVVGCATLFGACKLDQSAFERNVEAGVSSKDKQDNGGGDLVPTARAKPPAAGAAAPAADGGMPEPQPPAAEAVDAGLDAHTPDATPSEPTTTTLATDGGNDSPDPEDDAGAPDPDPSPDPEPEPDPPPCTTHDCYCTTYCQRGTALQCPEEPPLADCIALCQQPTKPGCEAQELAAMRCKAELPADKYICDEDLLAFFVLGCQAEDLAARNCRTR